MARKRRSKVEDDEDDDKEEDKPAPPLKAKPRNDAYVGMLALTFLSLTTAAVLLYMDFESLNAQKVDPPAVTIGALGSSGAPAAQ